MAQDDLTVDVRLRDLLDRWQALRAAGATPTVDQLCRDCPELADALREQLGRLPEAADSLTTAFDSTLPQSSRPAPPWPGIPGYEPLNGGRRGGMGAVYQARHLGLDRIVAVKVLSAGRFASERELQQFMTESRLPAHLEHPHIVRVYDFNHFQEQPYIVMEWVDGGSLSEHMKRTGRDPHVAAALMEKIARAVHYLHQHKVWHRDLKPSNILIDRRGEPKIGDFGLAKRIEDPDETRSARASGTPPYMAPELFDASGRPSEQTDIWALGVTLFEMLTGRRPFGDGGSRSLYSSIRTGQPPRLRTLRPDLDHSLDVIVRRCLAKDPRDRYPTAEALADDLKKWQQGQAIRDRPWPHRAWRKIRRQPARLVALLAALVVLLMAASAVIYLQDPDRPLKEMRRELQSGRPVVVLGETGMPRWYRKTPGIEMEIRASTEQPLALEAFDYGMLELFPHPGVPSYRASADVRIDDVKDGLAGISVLMGERTRDKGTEDFFWVLSFKDRTSGEQERDREGRRLGVAEFGLRKRSKEVQTATVYHHMLPKPERFRFPMNKGEFHNLAFNVSRERLQVFFDGTLLGEISRHQMEEILADWDMPVPGAPDAFNKTLAPPGTPMPVFRETIGLYVQSSRASFKNVVIEALK